MMPTQGLDSRLDALWNRRAELTEAEWHELYRLVQAILRDCNPPELAALAEPKSVYVDDFFARNVFERQAKAVQPVPQRSIHAGAIREFFKNFLRDCLDSQGRNVLYGAESLHPDAEGGDELPRRPPDPCGCPDIEFDALEESGLSAAGVRETAERWLDAQEPWVSLYLGLHHCPDPDASMALIRLADRYAIASHHHKARKLGLSHHKSNRTRGGFRETLLGRWLEVDLKLALEPEQEAAIAAALALLCEAAMAKAGLALAKSAAAQR